MWAFAYFDAVPRGAPDEVSPVDVLCAAALHPKLTQPDLAWFARNRGRLSDFLATLPDADLATSDPALLDPMMELADGVELSLLSKVLHRKRPGLIPMLDRRLTDWYRFVISGRGTQSWPSLVRALHDDLEECVPLQRLSSEVGLTPLRTADIAIWMEGLR